MNMIDYIQASPAVMRTNIKNQNHLVQPLIDAFFFGEYKSFTIIASGSSYNAAYVAKFYMAEKLKIPVSVITPEQYLLSGLELTATPFVVTISQSGASTNIIQALDKMHDNGLFRLVLTGNIDSEAGKHADVLVDYGSGKETVRFVTQGFSTLVLFLALFANQVARCSENAQTTPDRDEQFQQLIDQVDLQISKSESFVDKNLLQLAELGPVFVCGNNANLGVAREAALKFQETLKIAAMHYEIEEFLHGPDIQVAPNYSVFLIDDYQSSPRIDKINDALQTATNKHYLLTSSGDESQHLLHVEDAVIPLLNGLVNVIPFQVISAKIMDAKASEDPLPLTQQFRDKIPIKKYH